MDKIKKIFTKVSAGAFSGGSDGIKIAKKNGLTSSKMLEYLYAKKPSGDSKMGIWADSLFIRTSCFEALRQRRTYLMSFVAQALGMTIKDKGRAYMCDIASGTASYIFETLLRMMDQKIFVLLRDIDKEVLNEAEKQSQAFRMSNFEFQQADAMSDADFRFKSPPNIFVSSGLYDWCEDDEKVKLSMRLVYKSLAADGYFIFTNQNLAVNTDFIKEMFKDVDISSLNVKIRKKELVNSWAESAGFTILDTKTDQWGYYSITLAQKIR